MRPNSDGFDAGPITRILTVLFVKAMGNKYVKRVWKRSSGLLSVFNVCIKVKLGESLAEAHAMRFVAQHTSVPVPKLYYAFVHKGSTYFVMSKIKGKMALNGWRSRTQESREEIFSQLRAMIAEIRAVPPPEGTRVGAVGGGPFCDCRLSKLLWGPYNTVRDFHQDLANGTDPDVERTKLPNDMTELFDFYQQASNHIVLTHGDLSSLNIMVDGDKVTGIVDWETSGWLPWYWEYTCAKNANFQNEFWADEVDFFFEPLPYELKMERIRQKYFGAF